MAEGQQDVSGRPFGWWPLRRKRGGSGDGPSPQSRPARQPPGRDVPPAPSGRPELPSGPLWVSGGVESQEVPGQLRPTRAKLVWRTFEPVPLGRAVRRAYRYLVDRWGSSREPVRVVRVPGVVWLAGEPRAGGRQGEEQPAGARLAVVGAGEVLVLARARNDRRYQLYHANLEQAASWSAGRLEGDLLAPWTNPLRHLLYFWLQQGVELTGIDGVVVCSGPGERWTALPAALACAVAGWRPPWVRAWNGANASQVLEAGRSDRGQAGRARVSAMPSPWPLEQAAQALPWPRPWGLHVAALRAAAASAALWDPSGVFLPSTALSQGVLTSTAAPTDVHPPGPASPPGELDATVRETGPFVLVTVPEEGEPSAVADASRQLAVWAWPETPGDDPGPASQMPPASGAGDDVGSARPQPDADAGWRRLLDSVAAGDARATRQALVALAGGSATSWLVVEAYGSKRTPEAADSLAPAPCGLLGPASEKPPADTAGPELWAVTPCGASWVACRIQRRT